MPPLEIAKFALFAQRSGQLPIDALGASVEARVNDPNGGGSFWGRVFSTTIPIQVRSNSSVVKVKPLPTPVPADFTGGVGQFALDVVTDKKQLKTNKSLNLLVAISGTGNVKLMDAPSLTFPKAFEHFAPQLSETLTPLGAKLGGRKTFEYTLVANEAGTHELPAISFSFSIPKRARTKPCSKLPFPSKCYPTENPFLPLTRMLCRHSMIRWI